MKNFLLLGLFAVIVIIGCNSSSEEMAAKSSADSIGIADAIALEEAEIAAENAEAGNDTIASNINLNTKTPKDKKFVKTAEIKFKTQNVLKTTEKIEDNAAKFGGYLTFSNLQNRDENFNNSRISRDSVQVSKQIVVENEMKLRVPNEKLDSFVRELNSMVLFLDYRVIKMTDVTLNILANEKKTNRLENYEKRQSENIDKKAKKLKETTSAEDNLLDKQNYADELQIKALELKDQVKYCDIDINIYQKPIIVKEIIADFDYVTKTKPNFFLRAWDSIVQGWWILAEVVVFLIKLWGIAILGLTIFLLIVYIPKAYNKYINHKK